LAVQEKISADIWLSQILWNKRNPAETSKLYSPSQNKFGWQWNWKCLL